MARDNGYVKEQQDRRRAKREQQTLFSMAIFTSPNQPEGEVRFGEIKGTIKEAIEQDGEK